MRHESDTALHNAFLGLPPLVASAQNDFAGCCGPLSSYLAALGHALSVAGRSLLFVALLAVALGVAWGVEAAARSNGPGRPASPLTADDAPLLAFTAAFAALLCALALRLFALVAGLSGAVPAADAFAWSTLGVADIVGSFAVLARFAISVRRLASEGSRADAWAAAIGTAVFASLAAVPTLIGLTLLGVIRAGRDAFFASIDQYVRAVGHATECPPTDFCSQYPVDFTWGIWIAAAAAASVVVYAIVFMAMTPQNLKGSAAAGPAVSAPEATPPGAHPEGASP